ncbi:hypothetical protein ASE49_10725 [Novosphingobium sp. Leaf2]|nr:hypothetical protein ASE49_10725 [Novosphingobium sp. Leaf2]
MGKVGFKQAMKMHDDVLHLGVVDSALRVCLPHLLGGGEIAEHANQIERAKISELETARVFYPAAHDKVELLHQGAAFLWE